MGFVDGIERYFHLSQEIDVLLFGKALRSDIKQLRMSGKDVAFYLVEG